MLENIRLLNSNLAGCDGLSPSSKTSGTRTQSLNSKNIVNTKDNIKKGITSINNIRIATINVRTSQDDIKLATVVQTARSLCIDVLFGVTID